MRFVRNQVFLWRRRIVTKTPKRLPRRVVEIVKASYKPSKADMGEEFELPDMTLEEAARRVMESVDVKTISRPKHTGGKDND